jgi:hypothetical protein
MEDESIIKIISMPRLAWYFEYCKKNKANNTFEVFDVYDYNCLISSKLYVIIHNFEVCFRNFCCEKIKSFFNNENFISNTNFGFWVRLFDSDRSYDIYNKVFASYFYKYSLTRKKLRGMLDNIRFIRNRIAHNECIIKYDYKLTYHYIVNILFEPIAGKIYDAIILPIDNFTHINNQFEAGVRISDLDLSI